MGPGLGELSPLAREVARHNVARRAAGAIGDRSELERLDREAAVTFGDPASRLVVYGTLRPGRSNHHLVAHLGTWRRATVRGRLGSWEGYPILVVADGDGDDVPADLLTSPVLDAHLGALDDFEGPAYRRELVVVESDEGPVVAQCYVDATDGVS